MMAIKSFPLKREIISSPFTYPNTTSNILPVTGSSNFNIGNNTKSFINGVWQFPFNQTDYMNYRKQKNNPYTKDLPQGDTMGTGDFG